MPKPWSRVRYALPPGITIGSLRMLNTYELHGRFEGHYSRLDDLVLEHIATQREMAKLDKVERLLCRMVAEGFSLDEIAVAVHQSRSVVWRKLNQMRWSLYGIQPCRGV